MPPFLDALHSGQVLLMDGAMGTELLRLGASPLECFEHWNLTHPEKVRAIHQAYVAAGAEVLLTHTFQAFPSHLKKYGLADHLEEIIRAAVQLAREPMGTHGFVLGDLGPGAIEPKELERMLPSFEGVDGLLVETASDTALAEAVARSLPATGLPRGLPVLFSATFLDEGNGPHTVKGHTPRQIARQATEIGVASLGVNCGREIGLKSIERILAEYRAETTLPLFARPNAGSPRERLGGTTYPLSEGALADGMKTLRNAGAVMIGGCCGTTPAHIAACHSTSRRATMTGADDREERGR